MNEILMEPNRYGYRVNIAHPKILPLYKRFKAWKKIPENSPMSDEERFEFESYILEKVERHEQNISKCPACGTEAAGDLSQTAGGEGAEGPAAVEGAYQRETEMSGKVNLKKQYLMYDLFGRCDDHTCGECSNFVSGRYHNKILRKCQVYGLSHSEATDWAKSYPACGMFNREWKGREVKEQKKHFSNFRPEEPIKGQMNLFGSKIGKEMEK